MDIDKVWQQGVTGKGIVVAVVDDGLQQFHPDLKDNYVSKASNLTSSYMLCVLNLQYLSDEEIFNTFKLTTNTCQKLIQNITVRSAVKFYFSNHDSFGESHFTS